MKTFSKRLVKIISLLTVITVIATSFVIPVSAADEDAVMVYTSVDLSSYATSKIWLDKDDRSEIESQEYTNVDGLFQSNNRWLMASWPLNLRTTQRTDADFPAQNATVSGDTSEGFTLTSLSTNVPYKMPPKTETAAEKEALLLNGYYAWAPSSQTISVSGNYSAMNFLMATSARSNTSATIQAVVTYTDGAKAQLASASVPLPVAHKDGQKSADNFVADVDRFVSQGPKAYATTSLWDEPAQYVVAFYEYSIPLDADKTVSSITFTHTGVPSAVVASVTMSRDWQNEVAAAVAAIDNAVANSTDVEAILAAVDAVNTVKAAGLDLGVHVTNYDDYVAFFADGAAVGDRLLEGLFANTAVSWGTAANLFNQMETIVSTIGEIGAEYGDLSEETRLTCESAYTEMVDLLFTGNKSNEEIKERVDLLASTEIDALKEIINQKVLYTTNTSEAVTHEYIIFDYDFSQPVDPALLNNENISVQFGNKAVDPALVICEPKLSDDDAFGVTVKVINQQDYSSAYTVSISDAVVGVNGGSWAYDEIRTQEFSALIEADTSAVTISDTEISGTLVLRNNMAEEQPYTVLVAPYSSSGMLLTPQVMTGIVADNAIANISLNLPISGDATKVMAYIIDDYTNMTLLTPSVKLK